jgi:hypothetical protein
MFLKKKVNLVMIEGKGVPALKVSARARTGRKKTCPITTPIAAYGLKAP